MPRGAEGKQKVITEFNDIILPATKQSGVGQTGIIASGPAEVLMPDKAALEACIGSKAAPGDEDMVTNALLSCRAETPNGAAPIEIKVQVQILLDEDNNPGAGPK